MVLALFSNMSMLETEALNVVLVRGCANSICQEVDVMGDQNKSSELLVRVLLLMILDGDDPPPDEPPFVRHKPKQTPRAIAIAAASRDLFSEVFGIWS